MLICILGVNMNSWLSYLVYYNALLWIIILMLKFVHGFTGGRSCELASVTFSYGPLCDFFFTQKILQTQCLLSLFQAWTSYYLHWVLFPLRKEAQSESQIWAVIMLSHLWLWDTQSLKNYFWCSVEAWRKGAYFQGEFALALKTLERLPIKNTLDQIHGLSSWGLPNE